MLPGGSLRDADQLGGLAAHRTLSVPEPRAGAVPADPRDTAATAGSPTSRPSATTRHEGLVEIGVPTLIVGGGASGHLPRGQLARPAELVRDGRLVTIRGGGHLVRADRPPRFPAALRMFDV